MLKVDHGDRGATMTIVGEITNDLVVDLVENIAELSYTFHWAEVELKVASPGGSVHALDYFIDAMANFQALCTKINTRALTHAASAAAILVSLGDRRLASRASLLQYHTGRIRVERAEVTAGGAAGMKDALDGVDGRLIRLLVQRARRKPPALKPVVLKSGRATLKDFRDGDWPVIARLTGNASARRRKAPKDLLAKLRKRVAAALNSKSVQPLTALYTELCALDQPISAALAMELNLIDELVPATGVPVEAPELEPKDVFRVPEWQALFPQGHIGRAALCRHTLILGESGSGKTVSGILPIVNALFDDDNRVGCALVIDPKREIEPLLAQLSTGESGVRTLDVRADGGTWILNLMSGAHSIEDDLEQDRVLTAAKKVLVRAASLVPKHPAKSLTGAPNRSHDPYWEKEGARMAQAALAITLLVLHRRDRLFGSQMAVRLGGPESRARVTLAEFGRRAGLVVPDGQIERIVKETREALDASEGTPPEVIRTQFARAVRNTLLYGMKQDCFRSDFDALRATCAEPADPGAFDRATRELLEQVVLASCRTPSTPTRAARPLERANVLAFAGIAAELMFQWPGAENGISRPSLAATSVTELLQGLVGGKELDELGNWIKGWQAIASGDGYRSHYNSLQGHVAPCFRDFADPGPAATLFFGCEPFYRYVEDGTYWDAEVVDFCSDVDDEDDRHVYVMHPELRGGPDTLIARALKACYFEAVLNSEKRRRKGGDMPLAAYVSDEFHRFVTSDKAHGEQSYIDTCRSFGAFCVFACQSVASLQHALAQDSGDWESNRAAVSMLLTNTATKFFFRSTDPETRRYLDELSPGAGAGRNVTSVRPLATLKPGECYAVTAAGRFEMRQLDPQVVRAAQPAGAEAAPDPDGTQAGADAPAKREDPDDALPF